MCWVGAREACDSQRPGFHSYDLGKQVGLIIGSEAASLLEDYTFS